MRAPYIAVPYIGATVLVIVFASAVLDRLIRRELPESHLDDESEAVVN